MIDEYSYSQEQLAEIIGKSRSHIANTMRLLTLPEAVQIYVMDGRLSPGQARALITLPDPVAVAQRILTEGLTARDVEAIGVEAGRAAGGRAAANVRR